MMKPNFHRLAVPGFLLAALTACNAGNPNAPVFNAAQSTPNLELSLDAGSTATGYVFYNDVISESIAGNVDQLANASIDTTGSTGLLTLSPPANQLPGIYYLSIDALNTNGTVSNTVVANVMPPGQPDTPTLVDFPMNGYTTERGIVTLFAARNEISGGLTLQLVNPKGESPTPQGVTVNGIYSVLTSSTNAYLIKADITVTLPDLQTNSATTSDGNTYSNGMTLQFTAVPTTDSGYTYTPYTENIYLHPI